MSSTLRAFAVIGLIIAFLPSAAAASGGTPRPATPSVPRAPEKTPEQQAIDHYNAGLSLRNKAWKLGEKAAQSDSEKKRAKYEKKALKKYERAIEEFRLATRKNREFHQAFSDLGYVLRRTGKYTEALAAYEQALALAPTYAEAIEYRAEAYLGLDRVDDAKQAYMHLFTEDRPRAEELLDAMRGWVAKRQADPGDLAADTVREFANWVAQREEIAQQTPSVSQLQKRKW